MGSAIQSRLRSHQQRRQTAGGSSAAAMSSHSTSDSPASQQPEDTQNSSSGTQWAAYLGLEGEASGEETDQGPSAPPSEGTSAGLQLARPTERNLSAGRRLQQPAPGFSQSLKRKASNPEWPRTAPLKSSKRRSPDPRPADTITINGEVYDRRRRPESFDNSAPDDLDLHLMPHHQSYFPDAPSVYDLYGSSERSSRDAFSSYRCISPSNVSTVTSLQSPPRLHARIPSTQSAYRQLFDWDELGSVASGSSYAFPAGASAVGSLASPTSQMRLASALGQAPERTRSPASPQRPRLQHRKTAPVEPSQKPSTSAQSQGNRHPSAPPHPLLPIPPPSPSEVPETTLTGSSGETKPKPKRIRKRAPAKGTPQAAMSANPEAPVHVARPPNAWILYRSDQLRIIRQDPVISKKPQADISKLIGALWREEKAEVKLWYEQQADIKKSEHLKAHPEYRFAPQRKDKRRSTSNVNASKSNISSSSSSSNNTIPVQPHDKAQSLAESTPASTPTSGVSPPQQQDLQLSSHMQNPELRLQNYADHLPSHFKFDHPDLFAEVSTSNLSLDPMVYLAPQSSEGQTSQQSGMITHDAASTVASTHGIPLLNDDSASLLDVGQDSLDLSSDAVWAEFLAGNNDRNWMPCDGLSMTSHDLNSVSMTARTSSSQSHESSGLGDSAPLTPGLDSASGFLPESFAWSNGAQDHTKKVSYDSGSQSAGDFASWTGAL